MLLLDTLLTFGLFVALGWIIYELRQLNESYPRPNIRLQDFPIAGSAAKPNTKRRGRPPKNSGSRPRLRTSSRPSNLR